MKKQLIIGLVIIALALGGSVYYFFSVRNEVNSVATVNREKISREEFDKLMLQIAGQQGLDIATMDAQTKSTLQTQVVDSLISQKLLLQAAEKSEVTAPKGAVDKKLNDIRSQYETEDAFRAALAEKLLTEEKLSDNILKGIIIEAYLEKELGFSSITATDEEVEKAYNEAKAGGGEMPPLKDIFQQVKDYVIRQKQTPLYTQLVEKLRSEAKVEITL